MSMSSDAAKHILGYTLLNDFSARDTQRVEMAMSTGPYKGKDFAWGLGPWIVTPDEFGEVAGTKMRVLVNGEVWAESTPGAMQWSFPEMIAYTSQDETANVGDVFGSGTVNNGCGFEIDRWIRPATSWKSRLPVSAYCATVSSRRAAKLVQWRGNKRGLGTSLCERGSL